MSHCTYPRIRVTFRVGLFLLAVCAGGYTATAQTAQFSYAVTTLGGGFISPQGVALDAIGNVYVADVNSGEVKEIPLGCVSSSCVTTLGGIFYYPEGVAVDGSGNVYVAVAGSSGGAVVEMPPGCASSSCVTTLGGGFSYPEGVAVDGSGNVYIADTHNNAVKEMPRGCASSSCVTTLGGGFSEPQGVAVDASGNVYVADFGNDAVKEMPPGCASSSCVTTLGGSPFYYTSPMGVAVDAGGNVYTADGNSNFVTEIPPGCVSSSCVATLGSGFVSPTGVAVDGSGNVYISDIGDHLSGTVGVEEIFTHGVNFHSIPVGTTSTAITLTFTFSAGGSIGAPAVFTQGATGLDFADAGTGSCTTNGTTHTYNTGDTCTVDVTFTPTKAGSRSGGAELVSTSGVTLNNPDGVIANAYIYGSGLGAQVVFRPGTLSTPGGGFYFPNGVAVDASGNIYVADTFNYALKVMPSSCASASCVTPLGGGFYLPSSVALDGSGNIYVTSSGNGYATVFEVPPNCYFSICVTTVGGGFTSPTRLAVDGSGNIYVTDSNDNTVKEMPPGCVSASCVTILGGGFTYPDGVAVDGAGNIYVADWKYGITEMPPGCASSSCLTRLGGGFNDPGGVAVDGSGDVYVADTFNNAVKEMAPGCHSSDCVTTVASLGYPQNVAVDGSGNIYTIGGSGITALIEWNLANPPSLSFATAGVGSESSDSPRTVTLQNIGNAALSFPVPSSGKNPSISENFTLDSTTTCPEVSSSSSPGSLAANASCVLAVDFIPQAIGTINGSLALTDNSLNAHYATQTINLSGTGAIHTTTTVAATANPQELGAVVDFVVKVVASGGGVLTNQKVTLAIDGGAPLGLTLNSAGQAVFGTASLTTGTHTITAIFPAQAGYGPSSATLQEMISTSPASIATLSGSGQSTPYGLEFTEPLVALVTDAHGNPVPGATVSFSGTGLRFSSTTAVTNASGQATVRAYPTTAGTLNALANASGVGAAASFSLSATKPTLLVKADSATYTFDQPIPAPTYSLTGFVNGDTAATAVTGSAAISTPAKQGSPAGTYPIGLVQGTLSAPNYTLEFEQGTISITP